MAPSASSFVICKIFRFFSWFLQALFRQPSLLCLQFPACRKYLRSWFDNSTRQVCTRIVIQGTAWLYLPGLEILNPGMGGVSCCFGFFVLWVARSRAFPVNCGENRIEWFLSGARKLKGSCVEKLKISGLRRSSQRVGC